MSKKEKWEEMGDIECNECGKRFSSWKCLAGHILRSNDHENKKWAKYYIAKTCKKHGLSETEYDFSWIVPRQQKEKE